MKIKKLRPITIAGNWKMNNTISDSITLIIAMQNMLNTDDPDIPPKQHDVRIIVAPPYLSIADVRSTIQRFNAPIEIAAQNMFFEDSGAYTSSVSGIMLKDAGCNYAIVGHSELRRSEHMTDENVNKRVLAALKNKISPIFCIGESLQERESNQLEAVITKQLSIGLTEVTDVMMSSVIIAYEPVWAIGTGRSATPEQAEEVHKLIRNLLSSNFGTKISQRVTILYGGSVNEKNCKALLENENIDGALIGAVSLRAKEFVHIIKIAEAFNIAE